MPMSNWSLPALLINWLSLSIFSVALSVDPSNLSFATVAPIVAEV